MSNFFINFAGFPAITQYPSLKDFVNDLKILAKFSPDLVRFVFRNTPVVFLGKDILDASKEWNITDIAKSIVTVFAELVPIIGPITFYTTNEKTLANIWASVIWLWLDTWFVLKTKPENLVKLVTTPFADAARFVGSSIDIVGRYTLTWANAMVKIFGKNCLILFSFKGALNSPIK